MRACADAKSSQRAQGQLKERADGMAEHSKDWWALLPEGLMIDGGAGERAYRAGRFGDEGYALYNESSSETCTTARTSRAQIQACALRFFTTYASEGYEYPATQRNVAKPPAPITCGRPALSKAVAVLVMDLEMEASIPGGKEA